LRSYECNVASEAVVGAGGAGLTLLDARKKKLVFRAAVGDGADDILGQEVPLKGSRHDHPERLPLMKQLVEGLTRSC